MPQAIKQQKTPKKAKKKNSNQLDSTFLGLKKVFALRFGISDAWKQKLFGRTPSLAGLTSKFSSICTKVIFNSVDARNLPGL